MNEIAAQAAELAARLRDQAARLTAEARSGADAAAGASSVAGLDGPVSVTVTGGRVDAVTIDSRALGGPLPELEEAVARAVNRALAAARDRTGSPGTAAPPAAEAERFTSRLADEQISARSADRQVTVTVSGTGEIQAIRMEESARQDSGGRRLGDSITSACNQALGDAHYVQQRELDALRPDGRELDAVLDDRVSQHARQMDALLDHLADIDRRIGG